MIKAVIIMLGVFIF